MSTNKIHQIEAQPRVKAGRKAKNVRIGGAIPGILYGNGVANVQIAINQKAFEKILPELTHSTLINLVIEGEKDGRAVLVSEVQRNPMTGLPQHIDFHQVNLKEEIEATVPLVFHGESFAVKDLAGTLVKSLSNIKVQALPQDLPENIIVDIGALKDFEARITIADLNISDKVKVLDNMEEIVAVVTPPRSEAEMEELNKEVEENAGEVKTEADEKKAAKEAEAVAEGTPAEGEKGEKKEVKKETKKEEKK
ncbi:MAG: 50S ribosomal protein L25 [bacterium]|nr:50S ribosomal protein L25 [bacterium]